MKAETFNLVLGAWGTLTGTVALVIQFLGHRSDRASLRVAATMSYGSNLHFGRGMKHLMNVRLTNAGRRVVRIRSIGLRIHSPLRAALSMFIFQHHLSTRVLQSDIKIYSAAVDPIQEMATDPQIKTYPPPSIVLDENQLIELQLLVAEELLQLLPKRKAWLIVKDHVGREYKARYFSI